MRRRLPQRPPRRPPPPPPCGPPARRNRPVQAVRPARSARVWRRRRPRTIDLGGHCAITLGGGPFGPFHVRTPVATRSGGAPVDPDHNPGRGGRACFIELRHFARL